MITTANTLLPRPYVPSSQVDMNLGHIIQPSTRPLRVAADFLTALRLGSKSEPLKITSFMT